MVGGVIVAGLQVIEPSFVIVVIATVAQGVDAGHCAGAGEQITPCVVGISRNGSTGGCDQFDNIALQVQDVIIGREAAAAVRGILQCEWPAGLVIDKVEDFCRRAGTNRFTDNLAALGQVSVNGTANVF